jgi:hypothetical protein
MNKLFLQACVVFSFLLSCQSEEIVSSKVQSNGKKSNALSAAEISSLSNSNISDPTFIEPDNSESDGGAGGDLTFVPPTSPTMSNAVPFVASGKAGTLFTSTGQLVSDLIAMGPAEPTAPSPGIILLNAAHLWMGFNVTAANVRYIVRGYPIAINNGTAIFWTYPVTVQVVVGSTVNSGLKWVPTEYKNDGSIASLAHFDCIVCSPQPGVMEGQVTMTELNINALGQITLKAKLEIPQIGKTFQINKVNYKKYADY